MDLVEQVATAKAMAEEGSSQELAPIEEEEGPKKCNHKMLHKIPLMQQN